uniref:Uncharacterized protein LOC102802988 n=1 Tax=Saccoglossus kowalevskii TaxID=10224 RepID=A0ABM0MTF6_SACKO|nr:PREDICTED: uncharacterized protein LOC102802988 [Saccoglossus kowalevskii]
MEDVSEGTTENIYESPTGDATSTSENRDVSERELFERQRNRSYLTKDFAFFIAATIATCLYLLFGADIFRKFEEEREVAFRDNVTEVYDRIRMQYGVTKEDCDAMSDSYDHSCLTMTKSVKQRIHWDFMGAIFFATEVVSTIGLGQTAPKTYYGRLFCMVYCIPGIALFILFVITLLERFLALFAYAKRKVVYFIRHLRGQNKYNISPPPTRLETTVLFVVAYIVLCCLSAFLYQHTEDWNYFESFYFAFSTYTTIGFGDYVPVSTIDIGSHDIAYHVVNNVMTLFGVSIGIPCLTFISKAIKQGVLGSLMEDVFSKKEQEVKKLDGHCPACEKKYEESARELEEGRHIGLFLSLTAEQNIRMITLLIAIFIYCVLGSCVFPELERDFIQEIFENKILLEEMRVKYSIAAEDLADIDAAQSMACFGLTAPMNFKSRAFLICYASFGIPLMFMFLNLLSEHLVVLVTSVSRLIKYLPIVTYNKLFPPAPLQQFHLSPEDGINASTSPSLTTKPLSSTTDQTHPSSETCKHRCGQSKLNSSVDSFASMSLNNYGVKFISSDVNLSRVDSDISAIEGKSLPCSPTNSPANIDPVPTIHYVNETEATSYDTFSISGDSTSCESISEITSSSSAFVSSSSVTQESTPCTSFDGSIHMSQTSAIWEKFSSTKSEMREPTPTQPTPKPPTKYLYFNRNLTSYQIMLSTCVVFIATVTTGTLVYSKAENWTYFEACYFSIISFTTIGFGDYVTAVKTNDYYTNTLGTNVGNNYVVINVSLQLIGVSITFLLIQCLAFFFKEAIDALIDKIGYICKKTFRTWCRKRRATVVVDSEGAPPSPPVCQYCRKIAKSMRESRHIYTAIIK